MSASSQKSDNTRRQQADQVPVTTNGFMPMPQFALARWAPAPLPWPLRVPQPRPYQPLPMNPYGFSEPAASVLADDPFYNENTNTKSNQEPVEASVPNQTYQYPSPTWQNTSFGVVYDSNPNQGVQSTSWTLPPQAAASYAAPLPKTPTPAGPVKRVAAAAISAATKYQDRPAASAAPAAKAKKTGKFACTKCNASYITRASLDRHMDKHNGVRYQCGIEGCMHKPVMRYDSVKRHIKAKHPGQPITISKLEPVAEEDEDNDDDEE